jgi:hypothetical protein
VRLVTDPHALSHLDPALLLRVLLGGSRLEFEADKAFLAQDLRVVAGLDHIRIAGPDLEDSAVVMRHAHRPRVRSVGMITVFVMVVGGAAESLIDSEDFPTIWDGIWWSVVTITTVGYGDLYPKSVDGRIVGMIVMLIGIGFIAVLTATIASRFIQTDTGSDEMKESLARIEAELADVKRRLAERPAPSAP